VTALQAPDPSQGEVDNKIAAPDARGPQCAPASEREAIESANGSLVVVVGTAAQEDNVAKATKKRATSRLDEAGLLMEADAADRTQHAVPGAW